MLFGLIDERYRNLLPTIYTSNTPLEWAQALLNKCLLDVPEENNIYIRRIKVQAAALSCYVYELEKKERQKQDE